ncbi:hypothetical protein EYC84_009333 [Monilinia fructicola]|uniref:TFIIS central domain-containing protein n=1 Tax=Monilinia fructicola TaxID=38448 RepID=A0A5M9J7J5_MONFR|nr:hypothetical protein EYC84_009333 [Monilinia fructicola]
MADVRKSSRATKGQHPKAHELDQPIETKKKGRKVERRLRFKKRRLRGEQPWIARQEKYEEEKAEQERKSAEEAARKKGKKGKKRQSDQNATQKRKARDESHDKDIVKESSSKVRKTSARPTPRASPPSDLPTKITELETEQQGQATLIKKGLLQSIPHAIEERYYTLRHDDTIEAKAERLAIQIEVAVRTHNPNKSASIKQIRSIFLNLKQNQELCNGLLTQSLTPQALAVMTTDDMASKELKRETAIMKARADKQSIMITDDGPRIRRTHKGEEIIEGDGNPNDYSDIPMSATRRREMLDPNAGLGDRSRSRSPENEVELPEESSDDYSSRDKIRSSSISKVPLNIDTKQPALRKGSTQGSATGNFDINKVFSSVQSPHPTNKRVSVDHYRRMSGNAPPVNGPGDDPDVDKMLQDDNESPPYSPVEDNPDPDIVWRGTVSMDAVAKFSAYAKQVAGPDLSRNRMQTPWSELLHKDLKVHGRIDADKANEYLCGLRYSPPSDVIIINITPASESQDFLDLYNYFHDKKRPLTAGGVAQRQMSINHSGPAMSPSPVVHSGGFHSPSPAVSKPDERYQQQNSEEQRRIAQADGEAVALRILGEYSRAPTVSFLMPQAYQMRDLEWQAIRSILERDEKAQNDLKHLSECC